MGEGGGEGGGDGRVLETCAGRELVFVRRRLEDLAIEPPNADGDMELRFVTAGECLTLRFAVLAANRIYRKNEIDAVPEIYPNNGLGGILSTWC